MTHFAWQKNMGGLRLHLCSLKCCTCFNLRRRGCSFTCRRRQYSCCSPIYAPSPTAAVYQSSAAQRRSGACAAPAPTQSRAGPPPAHTADTLRTRSSDASTDASRKGPHLLVNILFGLSRLRGLVRRGWRGLRTRLRRRAVARARREARHGCGHRLLRLLCKRLQHASVSTQATRAGSSNRRSPQASRSSARARRSHEGSSWHKAACEQADRATRAVLDAHDSAAGETSEGVPADGE